jgi:hypothetical protein
MSVAEVAATAASVCGIIIALLGGLRYLIRTEVPQVIQKSHLAERLTKLEDTQIEMLALIRAALHTNPSKGVANAKTRKRKKAPR